MIYRLYIYDKRVKKYEAKGNYKTRQMAKTKAKPYIEKGRKIKIVALPEKDELDVGFKIYLSNGRLYGEIIDESDSFWFIRRSFKNKDDRAFFLKDSFLEKYEDGIFIIKEDVNENRVVTLHTN